jgi:curli biogenesis system outer membrane secretion channel CsgG
MKPIVAVMDFENRANFTGKWELGDGMADLLTTELLKSKKVTVLERQNLDDVVGEIIRQGKELFRKEGRVERGRLKNARYIIRGVVTDFTVVRDASGWFGLPEVGIKGRSSRSRVALNVRVSDVETGEVISSVRTDASATAGLFGGEVNYKRLSFGGDAFLRTPLGRATESAIRKAVKRIVRDMPTDYWQPRIAEAGPDTVIINGGTNVRLREGDTFIVRGEGRVITDPITGNVIEEMPGREVGRIRLTEVKSTSAHATILEGTARRGYFLERLE